MVHEQTKKMAQAWQPCLKGKRQQTIIVYYFDITCCTGQSLPTHRTFQEWFLWCGAWCMHTMGHAFNQNEPNKLSINGCHGTHVSQ